MPWSHKPATRPYPQIHYFYPKAQNFFFTSHVSVILSAMPTSPSSTLCTGLTNILSFTYFSYKACCACYVSRPIHPHSFGHHNNIRETWSFPLHKLLQSSLSPFRFPAAPNTLLSILWNTLSMMYKFGFRSLAASSVEVDTHQRTMSSTSARWATRSVGSWCVRYLFLFIQPDSVVHPAPNPTCMQASLGANLLPRDDANYFRIEPTLNFSVATPPQKNHVCSINDSLHWIMLKIYKK